MFGKGSEIKKGALLNYATIILTNVVGLLLTPYIIIKLGDSEYGIYTTIGALIGTLSVLDFGLYNTIVRFVAKYQAERDHREQENFLAITMWIYMILALIVLIIGYVIYLNLQYYFTAMSPAEVDLAKKLFIILILNIAIGLPGSAFTGICLGYERFVFPKALGISRYVIRSLMVVALLYLGGKALALVILDTIFNIVVITITIFYVSNRLDVKFKIHSLQKKYFRNILRYSFWIFIYSIVAQFQWRAGHIALSNFATPEILGVYAVGIMLGGYYGAFSSAITSVFLPRATQMTVNQASAEELTNEMIKLGRISLLILMYILGAFVLYGKEFVLLWVGPAYLESWIIALLIMLAYTIPLAQGFTGPLIEAKDKVAFKSSTYLIFLGIGTLIGFLLGKKYGAIGMVSGTIIGWIIAQNIMNYFYYKVLDLNMLRFFRETFRKIIPSQIAIMTIGYLVNMINGDGWIIFIFKGLIYSLIFGLIMFNFGTIPYERNLIRQLVAKIK